MNSQLLVGTVHHRRLRPRVYDFRHRVYYLALDLDELAEVERRVPLIGIERPRPLAIFSRDHFCGTRIPLAAAARAYLAAEGFDAAGWTITLVTNARVLGYVFNPVSFYLCRDEAGALAVVIAEVSNTHGDQRLYTLRAERPGGPFDASTTKRMYVSPFIGMEARYRFRIKDDAGRLRVALHEHEGPALTLFVGLHLDRRPLTLVTLGRVLLSHPHITLGTIALIHLHALRLWRHGLKFLPYRDPP